MSLQALGTETLLSRAYKSCRLPELGWTVHRPADPEAGGQLLVSGGRQTEQHPAHRALAGPQGRHSSLGTPGQTHAREACFANGRFRCGWSQSGHRQTCGIHQGHFGVPATYGSPTSAWPRPVLRNMLGFDPLLSGPAERLGAERTLTGPIHMAHVFAASHRAAAALARPWRVQDSSPAWELGLDEEQSGCCRQKLTKPSGRQACSVS